MSNPMTNGATIIVVSTDESYHTYDDWTLYITNNNYIGNPEQHLDFIEINGRNGLLDVSEVLVGRPTYKNRNISIELCGIKERTNWDAIVSDFRNKIDGKVIKLIFDNDPTYYWYGRVHVEDFDRARTIGKFKINIPNADPYKYSIVSFNEDWLWDPFDFENGYVTEQKTYVVTQEQQVIIPAGLNPVIPTVNAMVINTTLTVQDGVNGRVIPLELGEHEVPQILVNGSTEKTLIFKGNGTFTIDFRGISL